MRPAILALLGCLFTLGCAQEPQYTELTLKGDAIAKQIQFGLAGTKGELHADKVDPDGTRHPGCWIQLGPALHDKRFEFSLPEKKVDLGYAGTITYHVADVRLGVIEVAAKPNEFVLTSTFTSEGVAIKGEHSSLGGAVVPGIKLTNMRLVVHLKPVVVDGSITYDDPRVEFTADVDNTFIPRFSVMGYTVDIIDAMTHYRHDLCLAIQRQIQAGLEDPGRKAALADQIRAGIAGQLGG
ncbi:MAG TPA: hypothetical protein VMI31_03490, partial [Fimbriimonadaceae bacterium]|nr:hypothetical protein [Fimbriimonadaceae bacterium]